MNTRIAHSATPNSMSVLRSFLAWWGGELAGLIPAALRENPTHRRRGLLVHLTEDSIRIEALKNGQRRELGTLVAMPAMPEAERRALETVVSRGRLASAEVGLVLSDLRVLRKSLEFPTSAESDLDAIIANQIDRLTPYRAGQVRFSHRVVARDRARRRLSVELVAVATAELDSALDRLRGWSVRPSFLWVEGAGEGDAVAIDIRAKGQANRHRRRPPLIPVLAGVNLVLLIAAFGVPLWERHSEETRLREQAATAKLRAETVLRLRGNVEAIRDELAFLSNRQTRLPVMVLMLNELTRAIPDGTWIEELRLGAHGLDLRGQSPRASALIGATEGIPLFRKVEFRAPVTRDGPMGTERFHISAEFAVGGQP